MSEKPTLVEALEAVESCTELFASAGMSGLCIEAVPLGPLHPAFGQSAWCVGFGEPGVWQFYGYPIEAVDFVRDVCAVHNRERHERWVYLPGGDKAPA